MILLLHCPFNIYHKFLLEVMSIPLEGSSKNIIWLPPINAIPIESFLFWPVDKCFAKVYWASSNWNSFIILLISFSEFSEGTPLNIEKISKCSLTFKLLNKTSC